MLNLNMLSKMAHGGARLKVICIQQHHHAFEAVVDNLGSEID